MKRGRLKDVEGGIQERQLVIIKRPFVSPQKRCDRCVEPSGMITPDEAAAVCGVSTRTIYRWLETGSIHFSESGDGALQEAPPLKLTRRKERIPPAWIDRTACCAP